MANNSPTIIAASLSDDQLKKSIDSLVTHVDEAMKKMVQSTNNAVGEMEAKLKSLGNLKIDSGGSADGGASKRAKAQNAETDAVEKNVAARDKQIKKNQEAATSFDNFAKAQQVAIRSANPSGIRNADTLQTMNIQLDLLRERLREARQQYSSFVALAAHATTTGDKGLFQFATDGVHRYEQEVRNLIPQIRTLQSGVQQMGDVIAPQGHTIQNYVNSLQKANPELALLNAQYKSGTSLLQNQSTSYASATQSAQRHTEQTEKENRALQEQKEHLERIKDIAAQARKDIGQYGFANITNYRGVVYAENDARSKGLTIEQQIEKIIQEENAARNARLSTEKQITQEVEKQKKEYVAPSLYKSSVTPSMLRPFVEEKLGLGFGGAVTSDATSQIKTINAEIKQLNETWQKMSDWERKSPFGDTLRQRMQMLQRQSQQLNQQLSRPISLKDALSGSEKTLDDIAHKMRRLASYRSGLNIETQTKEIDQVNRKYAELQKKMNDVMRKNTDMIASNTALGRSWNYMKNRLAFYFTVGASTQFIKNLIEVRSQYEMNERALGILINSAERGTQIFNELSQMALVSPYTLIELSTAAKQLTAYDVAARDVVDTTRRLADMAAAVGIPIERLTYALGQIKAYGYLNSRDARMFANAGIPLVKQLSDYYTELEGRLVSTADVYDRIKKKAIDYNEVMEVINKMTDQGGKFFDFQAKMADTLKVRLANLTLAWNNMLNDMGKESQGVLTWGIGALREMFLRWKQLDSLIKNAAWVLGIRTALMFIAYSALKVGAALGVTNKQMALSSVFGTRLAGVLKTVAASFKAIVTSPLTWWSLLAIAAVEATQALFGVNEAQKALNESIRNGAKDNYDNISKFIEQYKEVRESLYSTKKVAMGSLYNPETRKAEATLYVGQQVEQDIDKNEAKKAWEAVREQIELTVASSDKYIGNLLSISNMSERVRQGFNLLDDVQVVNAALKELDDDTIKVSKDLSAWWNAWQAPDGLIGNLKDYQEALNDIIAEYGTLESFRENTSLGGKGSDDLNDYETALERFRDDLQKTTDSIINFIELKGWSGDESKINQVFEQITQKLILDNQLDPQKAFTLQTEVEEARSKAAREALLQRINDEKEAYKISHDEQLRQSINTDVARYNSWSETNGRSKVEWERFTKWLKEQHISETTAMFRNMDAEDIKSLNFQEGKHAEWVTRMVTQYAKEHKMSYDEAFKYLRSWVRSANQWSIFIPLTISTEDKKSVYDQLGEYDKAVDEADAQIERLTKRINELNAKKKKSKEETEELGRAEQELADAQKAKADAESKGGHGKKEKKDRKKDEKDAKQAETELQKALKDELSTIDKVRSIYKDLTKEGMSHANAVERATRGWDETVNAINRVLQKNGLRKLDLSKFAGIENPRELVNMLQSQLNTLLKRGAKSAEIKEFQTKINTLWVDVDKYDLDMITKGLNNELGKLKDEYELAVELDANPEMGNLFADWMGIDMSSLPHTAEEYAKRMTKALNKYLAEEKSGIEIGDLLALTDDDLRMFHQRVDDGELTQAWVDNIVKDTKEARNALKKENGDIAKEWDNLVQKYAEYEYKIAQIQRNANKERKAFALKYGSNEQKERALVLTTEIDTEKDQAKKQELINQLKQLLLDIAGNDESKLKIPVAIDKKELEEGAKVAFEEFQKTPEWIVATGDLANMSKHTIGMLIGELEKYKRSVKDFPKQTKKIDSALSKLYKEQRKDNPFKAITNMLDEAKERMSAFDEDINKAQKEIDKLRKKQKEDKDLGIIDDKTQESLDKAINKLNKLKEEQKEVGEIDATSWVSAINELVAGVQSAVSVFNDLAKAIGGVNENNDVDELFSALKNVGSAAATGASIGGAWGAVIGAVAGGIASVITNQINSYNKWVDEVLKRSNVRVKELELAYIDLEHAVNKAYGEASIGAKKAAIANKKAQLAALEGQLEIERLREAKNKDEEKIVDLQKKIKELQYDIKDSTDAITNDLLGISSVGDAATSIVKSMIDAFKRGEDYMKVFGDSFEDMINNLIVNAIAGRVIGELIDEIWNDIDSEINKETYTRPDSQRGNTGISPNTGLGRTNGGRSTSGSAYGDARKTNGDNNEGKLITPERIQALREKIKTSEEETKAIFDLFMELFGVKYGQDSNSQLSKLQQGIAGITEDTAGALEGITNGISQQCYLQSDILMQIRDTVAGFDMDVQTATQAQMLLQLQNNYIVMQSMQSMMENWTVPSGSGIRVELMS